MLFLKIMSSQSMADSDACHNFTLIPVASTEELTFDTQTVDGTHVPAGTTVVWARIRDTATDKMREFSLTGNAYVLNEHGKTIASHASY